MHATRTLRQMANDIALLDGRGAIGTAKLYQQLRVLSQRGLFAPATGSVTQGQTAEYDIRTVCGVRHLTVLYDLGINAGDLRGLIFKQSLPADNPTAKFAKTDLDVAIEGILAGQTWVFCAEYRRHFDSGDRKITGGFRRLDEKKPRQVSELLDAWGELQASLTLPSSELLLPLLKRIAA